MSRSGYSNDIDTGILNLWRGNVDRSIAGKRGQAFLKEMAKALDEMPEKKLIVGQLISDDGAVCPIGSVCKARGLDVSKVDVYDPQEVGDLVGISRPLAAEISYLNDDDDYGLRRGETPEERWVRMRDWIREKLNP